MWILRRSAISSPFLVPVALKNVFTQPRPEAAVRDGLLSMSRFAGICDNAYTANSYFATDRFTTKRLKQWGVTTKFRMETTLEKKI